MNEKWIPGPWWVESDADEEVEGTLYICHEGTDSPDTTICAFEGYDKDDEANAHLIAAAPEMAGYIKRRADDGCPEAAAIWEIINGR